MGLRDPGKPAPRWNQEPATANGMKSRSIRLRSVEVSMKLKMWMTGFVLPLAEGEQIEVMGDTCQWLTPNATGADLANARVNNEEYQLLNAGEVAFFIEKACAFFKEKGTLRGFYYEQPDDDDEEEDQEWEELEAHRKATAHLCL